MNGRREKALNYWKAFTSLIGKFYIARIEVIAWRKMPILRALWRQKALNNLTNYFLTSSF